MKQKILILSTLLLLTSCNINLGLSSKDSSNITSSNEEINSTISTNEEVNSSTDSSEEIITSIEDSSSENEETSISIDESIKTILGVNDLNQDEFYNEFFNYTSDIQISLRFTNLSIYQLAKYAFDSYKKDMYHPCELEIIMNDTTYYFPNAGARMKGNTSRNEHFVDKYGMFHAPVHFKVSVNETFETSEDNDYYTREYENTDDIALTKKRRIGGAKKFDLKYNKQQDNAFTKQIYAYNCFESEGIPVQKNNLVKLSVYSESDSYTQNYELQECIDEEFIKRRFDETSSSGNLYKSCYTAMGPADMSLDSINRIGIEDPTHAYSYDLKTNKKIADHSLLTNFITTLNNDKSDASTFKSTLDNILDVDEFIKYAAMSWVIGNPDDLRNNYNNYYTYFSSSTNKAIIIPYDYDRCFGILHDWPIDLSNVPWYTTKQNLESRNWQTNPLYWRTILVAPKGQNVDYASNYPVIEEYRNRYYELCVEYANKYLDVDKYKTFNDQFVYSNKDIENAGSINQTFETYAQNKLNSFNI